MQDDSETFDVTFVVEQQGDGPRRLVRSIETHPDGSQNVIEYEEALPANDRYDILVTGHGSHAGADRRKRDDHWEAEWHVSCN